MQLLESIITAKGHLIGCLRALSSRLRIYVCSLNQLAQVAKFLALNVSINQ